MGSLIYWNSDEPDHCFYIIFDEKEDSVFAGVTCFVLYCIDNCEIYYEDKTRILEHIRDGVIDLVYAAE